MKKYTGEIYEGLKIRVSFYKNPGAWTENAIYEIEEIVSGLGFKQIKFKGYNLLHDLTNLIFSEINAFAPAPIKEDAKHTAGELPEKLKTVTFGKGSLSVFGIHERKNNRSIYSVEHFDKDQRIFNETVSSAIVTRYNEYPTLLKENEQLKAEIERLRKWAVETIDISQNLAHKREEQVNVLREALQLLTNSTNLSKLNIRKDFTLINAHANGLKALKKTETN